MRNKCLGTGEPGWHLPCRLTVIAAGPMPAGDLDGTAVEAPVDCVETRHDGKIGSIEDIAAAGAPLFTGWIVLAAQAARLEPRLATGLQESRHAD